MKALKAPVRGSVTVEAAVVVPIVIITLMVVLYIMLLIFQTGIMYITVNNIAERAAATYYSPKADFLTGEISKEEIACTATYRRWSANPNYVQNDFNAVTLKQFKEKSILKGKSYSLEILQGGNIVNKRITVVLSASYSNPMGSLTAAWGLGREIKLKARAEAIIDDPVEFIRNADYIVETALRVPLISEFESKWHEIVNKVVAYINKLAKKLEGS